MRRKLTIDVGNGLHWKELGGGDFFKLRSFFGAVLSERERDFARKSGRCWESLTPPEREKFHNEAINVMFALRGLPFGFSEVLPEAVSRKLTPRIDKILPVATVIPSVMRLFQLRPTVLKWEVGSYHVGALWDEAEKEILGVAVLEDLGVAKAAELSCWKNPKLDVLDPKNPAQKEKKFQASVEKFLHHFQTLFGYECFVANINEMPCAQLSRNVWGKVVYGLWDKEKADSPVNAAAFNLVKDLGFELVGRRLASKLGEGNKSVLVTPAPEISEKRLTEILSRVNARPVCVANRLER